MIQLSVSQEIDQSPSAVFARLVDFGNDDDWMPRDDTKSSSAELTSEGEMGAGSTYVDHTAFGDFDGEVLEFERPHRVVFHQVLRRFGMTLIDGHQENVIEVSERGCRLTWNGRFSFGGPLWFLQPFLKGSIREEREAILAGLAASFDDP